MHFTPPTRFQRPEKAHKQRINEEINAPQIRVIDDEGRPLGVMTVREALRIANERELDLVEIAPQAKPPVCKIVDYGKFSYELHKKEKYQRKHQLHQQMKELRFKWRTDTHDFNFKVRHARNFIDEGHKVKATVIFRGREIIHQEFGIELLKRFVLALEDIAKIDQEIKTEGKFLSVIMTPDKTKKKEK
ncbi:MAG: translation initiation factor IF-3 [Bacteroidetes bacterium]|nr:MAG: translation initiation factor IF-3 [Bacteroidota bacterium]